MARRLIPAFLALALLAIPATLAVAQAQNMMAPVSITMAPQFGQILTDSNGKALYWHVSDPGNASLCTDACATAWPPFVVDTNMMNSMMAMDQNSMMMMESGPLGTIMRADGSMQYTWQGHPLYHFSRDQNSGDVNGNGINAFGGVWNVVSLGMSMGSM